MMSNKSAVVILVALVLGAAPSAIAHAQSASSHANNLMGEGIGVAGFDPVAYFPEGGGKPAKGSIQISTTHDGVVYRFANEANRKLFAQNPAKYVPAYGGWCAFAVAELGKRVDVDPTSFEIRNGKLYLFYRDTQLDTRALWLKGKPEALITKADAGWPKLAK